MATRKKLVAEPHPGPLTEIKSEGRWIRSGDLVRIRGNGRRPYRVRHITRTPKRYVVEVWGPVDRYDQPHPSVSYRSFDLLDVLAVVRKPDSGGTA